jgi:hypothetical protein
MECILLYLDDIDDLAGTLGLIYEPIRRLFFRALAVSTSLALMACGIWLALSHPPLALATCLLLCVTLLYRVVTAPTREYLQVS